jgi:hypothetical protein
LAFFKNYEEGSNVILCDSHYAKSKRIEGGKYSKDVLYCVGRDLKTGNKFLEIKESPKTEVYITKPEYRGDFKSQREYLDLDKLDKVEVKYGMMNHEIYNICKETKKDLEMVAIYDKLTMERKTYAKGFIHTWRHAYLSDYDIEDYAKMHCFMEYNPSIVKPTKMFLDIESDVYGLTEQEKASGEYAITLVTLIFDHQLSYYDKGKASVFTFALRNHKKYKQQKEFEKNLDTFEEECHNDFDSKFGDANYTFKMFDDEITMLQTILMVINIYKSDLCSIWNMDYDIPAIILRLKVLGVDPADFFCHKDFGEKMCYYYKDERNFDPANRGSYFKCLTYTRYIDQMCLYAAIRKGRADYGSAKLDNIASIVLKHKKREFDNPATDVINAIYREYYNFVLYNIQDVWLQVGIERKTGDMDTLFGQSYDGGTRIYKTLKPSIYLNNVFRINYLKLGVAMGNNVNKDFFDEDKKDEDINILSDDQYAEILIGAMVGDPENNIANGLKIYGKSSKYVYKNMIDLDFAAMYPNIEDLNNISKSTQFGRLIIPERVSVLENPLCLKPYFAGGAFIDDFETGDILNLGNKWLGMKPFSKYMHEFAEYAAGKGYAI